MNNEFFRDVIIAVCVPVLVFCAMRELALWREESWRWRRLIQLYLEKRVSAPLPIDEDPNAPADSLLSLPDEDLDEIERQQEEEERALRQ